MRIIADVSYQHNQLDDLIASEFIPEITGGIHCSTIERKLLSIPSQLGGIATKRYFDKINESRNSTSIEN